MRIRQGRENGNDSVFTPEEQQEGAPILSLSFFASASHCNPFLFLLLFFFFGIKTNLQAKKKLIGARQREEEEEEEEEEEGGEGGFPDEIREKVNFLLYTHCTIYLLLYMYVPFIKGMKTKSLFGWEKRKETTKRSWLIERVLPPSIPIFNRLRINITTGKIKMKNHLSNINNNPLDNFSISYL